MFSCSLLALLQLYGFLYLMYLFHCSGLFYSYSLSVFSLFTSQFLFFSLFLLCINVLYASYSSVCIFNVCTFALFFFFFLFHYYFSVCFLYSLFLLFSLCFQFPFSFYTLSLTTSGIRLSESKSLFSLFLDRLLCLITC